MMRKKLLQLLFAFGPCFGLALVFLLFSVLAPTEFHSLYNLKTIITQTVIVGIAALGMTYVIISGGIDLSVGSQIALCTVLTAVVLNLLAGPAAASAGLGVSVAAAAAGVLACALCGLVSGSLINGLRIAPFIATLGMMQIARGVAKWAGHEQTVICPSNSLAGLMDVNPAHSWMLFSHGVWLMIFLLVLTHIILRYTVFGRHVFAIGSNEQTARLCGVGIGARRVMIYTLCGVFTGVAGLMQFSNLTVGDPTSAAGMELDVIAAVVIGGGSLSGGEGGAVGTLVGALIMAVLRNGCNMLGIPNYFQEIIIGVIIIGAVAIDRYKRRLEG